MAASPAFNPFRRHWRATRGIGAPWEWDHSPTLRVRTKTAGESCRQLLGGGTVKVKLKARRLLDGQIRRFRTAQYFVHVGYTPMLNRVIDAIEHVPICGHKRVVTMHRWHHVQLGKPGDAWNFFAQGVKWRNENRSNLLPGHLRKHRLKLKGCCDIDDVQLQTQDF